MSFGGEELPGIPPEFIQNMLNSGQFGTPESIQAMIAYMMGQTTGQGATMGQQRRWLRKHQGEGSDPFGWSEFLEGKDYAPGQSRPYTIDELNARRQYQSGTFAKNPYSTAPQDAVGSGPPIEQGPFVNNLGGNPFITPEDMEILKKIPRNLRGQELLDALPPAFNEEYYRSYADSGFPFESFLGFGGSPRMTKALDDRGSKLAAANALGFGAKGPLQTNKGEFGVNDRVNRGNAIQALKSAGWDESMGYGPQKTLSDKMNQLLYAVSPRYDKSKLPEPKKEPMLSEVYDPFSGMQSAISRDAYVNDTLGGDLYGGVIPEEGDYQFDYMSQLRSKDPHFATPQRLPNGDWDFYPGWASNQSQQFGQLPYDVFGKSINDVNNPGRGTFAGNMIQNPAGGVNTMSSYSPEAWPNFVDAWSKVGGGRATAWGPEGGNIGGSYSPFGSGSQGPWGQQNSGPSFSPSGNPQAAGFGQQKGPSANPNPWINPWNMK